MDTTLPKGVPAHKYKLKNWLECIKTRQAPVMDTDSGHHVASMCILANLAYLLERPVSWDSGKEQFLQDKAANLLLGNPGRGEWRI